MDRRDRLHRLDLHDHLLLNDNVRTEPQRKPNGAVDDRHRLLANLSKSSFGQFQRQCGLINGFEQPGA